MLQIMKTFKSILCPNLVTSLLNTYRFGNLLCKYAPMTSYTNILGDMLYPVLITIIKHKTIVVIILSFI